MSVVSVCVFPTGGQFSRCIVMYTSRERHNAPANYAGYWKVSRETNLSYAGVFCRVLHIDVIARCPSTVVVDISPSHSLIQPHPPCSTVHTYCIRTTWNVRFRIMPIPTANTDIYRRPQKTFHEGNNFSTFIPELPRLIILYHVSTSSLYLSVLADRTTAMQYDRLLAQYCGLSVCLRLSV